MDTSTASIKLEKLKPVYAYTDALGYARSTGARWCFAGVRSSSGGNVKLKHCRAGRKLFTTDDWFQEFMDAQTNQSTEGAEVRSPSERDRAAERAGKELEAMGV